MTSAWLGSAGMQPDVVASLVAHLLANSLSKRATTQLRTGNHLLDGLSRNGFNLAEGAQPALTEPYRSASGIAEGPQHFERFSVWMTAPLPVVGVAASHILYQT